MTDNLSVSELAELFSDIGSQLSSENDPDAVLRRVTEIAVRRVPGAEYAGLTVGREGHPFSTVAATDDLVDRTDAIQYELGTGPCIDAILEDTRFNAPDLRNDPRWPEFGRRAAEVTGVRSMLSLRLYLETDQGLIAGLNMYSLSPESFSSASETVALLVATHGALAAGKAQAQRKSQNLLVALKNSREIGVAMGVLMNANKITRDQAFDLLRIASQHTHRKLSEAAAEVAETGVLPRVPNTRLMPNDRA